MTVSKQNQDGTPSRQCLETVITNLHETYQCRRELLMMGIEDARNM